MEKCTSWRVKLSVPPTREVNDFFKAFHKISAILQLGPGAWLPFRARRHLILVPLPQAKLTMAQALKLTRQTPGGLVTWITGPTRSADIEKVLILGAQGPGELEVVVYED